MRAVSAGCSNLQLFRGIDRLAGMGLGLGLPGVKDYRCNSRGNVNDRKRPREGQIHRDSWFGCCRGDSDVCRREHRHPGRHNDRSLHSGANDHHNARPRLVAQGMGLAARGLGLAAGMGLAPRLVVMISTQ